MAPAQLEERLNTLEEENADLRAQVEWFKRNLFGTGKSETLDALQTRLKLGEEAAAQSEESEPVKETISYERAKPRKRDLPAERFKDLPVLETTELIPEAVKADPGAYDRIGEETTFEVKITPPKLWKHAIVRPKFRHKLDRSHPPVVAPALKRPIDNSYASAELLAYIALGKYLYHIPLYRQEKMSAHWGAQLSRKTMADWIEAVADWFNPIYGRMRVNLLEGGYLQADETPIRFMDPDQKKGKTTQGYLWVIGKPGSDVVFDWRLSRKHDEATSLLDGFEGVLQSDGYGAYDSFAKQHENVVRVACWAHVRRKFVEAESESPVAVRMVLRLIGHLYRYERQWDERALHGSKHRGALRTAHCGQSLHLLQNVAQKLQARARPKSKLGKACTYLFGQWSALLTHCLFGETRIDNNLIENAIRPSAVGKKNFLFIGSPEAGQRSAIIYSIIVSCERHGIDPLAYMTDLLRRLPNMSNQDDLDSLLPSNWKEDR
jgi:transposase